MLVPYAAVYSIIALFGVLALVMAVMSENRVERKMLFKGLGWLFGIIAVVGGLGVFFVGSKTVIFEGKDRLSITHSKYLLLGTKTLSLPNGKTAEVSAGGSGAWVVNGTSIELRVKTAEYSTISFSFGGHGPSEYPVMPGTAYHSPYGVDNIGPDDPLPSSVSSKSSSETRVQVYW